MRRAGEHCLRALQHLQTQRHTGEGRQPRFSAFTRQNKNGAYPPIYFAVEQDRPYKFIALVQDNPGPRRIQPEMTLHGLRYFYRGHVVSRWAVRDRQNRDNHVALSFNSQNNGWQHTV